tara:strand:+ start:638 stop:2179 length:1542 start_codon:yes stop_codon:yes gene_type:complete
MGIQDGCVVITDIRISRMKGRCWGAAFAGSKLLELFTESDQETHQVGDILIGKVDRVLSGLAYAFVDLGQGQAGFLPTHETRYPELFGHEDSLSVRAGSGATAIQVGSPVLAQVVRAQEGDKGPRLSRRISLASSLIVYVPSGQGLSVSQKIKDEATRRRLEAMGRLLLKGQVGALVFRTLAGRATELELVQAFKVLLDRWRSLAARSKRSQAIRCIEETASAPLRWVTAWLNPDVMSVTVDADVDFQIIHDYLASAVVEKPALHQVHPDAKQAHQHAFQTQVERLLKRRVELPSGGYLVIDETEALVAIDVNTGSFIKGGSGEGGQIQTNLEAALVIPDELRLRQLAGIVVVDFIDMASAEDQRSVRQQLMQGLAADRMRCEVSEFSRLGLLEISRTKQGPSLLRLIEPNYRAVSGAEAAAERLFGFNPVMQIQDWIEGVQRELDSSCGLVIEVTANAWILRQLIEDEAFLQFSQRSGNCLRLQLQAGLHKGLEVTVNGQRMALSVGGDHFE